MQKEKNYDANSIETLNFREAIRTKIAMYMGSADNQGVLQGVREIISNSIDEFIMGYGGEIKIDYFQDNKIIIADQGRGCPFGKRQDGTEAMEAIFMSPHSGGKFSNKIYQSIIGMNGIGAKGVALSSKYFEARSIRDGEEAILVLKDGLKESFEVKKTDKKNGTIVCFVPGQEVFNLEPINISFDDIKDMCRNWSYLNKGLNFHLTNHITKEVVNYQTKNGILDLIKDNVKNTVHSNILYLEMKDGHKKVEIALQWTKEKERSFVFTNGLHNVEGGTSLTGLKTALTRTINKQFKKDFSGDMVRTGLVYAINVSIPNPSFANQTKTKINNPELRGLVDKAFVEAWKEFSLRYPSDVEKIQDFLTKEEKADKAAEKARNAIINSTKEIEGAQKKKVLMADKLKDCEKHGEEAMLVICEGDSALGALSQGRPIENVALLPIRGKIINVLRHDIEKILENEEVKSILMCLNSGINEKYNSNRLRYGKIGIAVDADADGYNIMCLITTLIYGLFPQFMEEGRLHWLRAPLYRIDFKQEVCYAFNDEELESTIKKKGKGKITRFKGLGEMDADDVEVAIFGQSQRLEKFVIKDKVNTYSQIEMLMGSEVEGRKKFIFDNIDFSKVEE